jgi:arylsulfatase A-like enzyme
MSDRPNILLITSDQQRADGFGFENPYLKTPHLDLLAGQGTRFAACIAPNLVGQPARASILTGLLPLTHGVWDNGVDLDPRVGEAGFAGTLARHGYRTALIGKAHFATKSTFRPTGTPGCRQSGARYGPNWHGPYMGFQYVELAVLGHLHRTRSLERPPVGHDERWLLSRGPDELGYKLWAQSLGPDVDAAQTWYSALPAAWHSSTWIADRAIAYLTQHDRQPFCLWASFPDPHHPFDCPAPWSRLYDPQDMALPKHRTKDLERRPWWRRAALEGTPQLDDPTMRRFRIQGSRIPDQTDEQLAFMTANYYGMISHIDHHVGASSTPWRRWGWPTPPWSSSPPTTASSWATTASISSIPDLLRVGLVVKGPGVRARPGRLLEQLPEPVGMA